ncbi:hypothetical protein [Azospirillum picis]|uniref:Uncharacterized protein n=1 Tax=Azospirillum picis TaxID=488438 RepID=A0ABU0MEV2_9PROT|nr:hypothetical protein [Azospirillum picis]MBP2297943.1 hypothetical protein [Azospirillum picis]MDQ0531781.1 hypothetical protein [Azospirillum picis]
MAITKEWELRGLRYCREQNFLPTGDSILEFGECEADQRVPFTEVITAHAPENRRQALLDEAASMDLMTESQKRKFGAKLLYKALFNNKTYEAVDLGGEQSHKIDLNFDCDLGKQYDICINNGTAEHVFNVLQFFTTVHKHTKLGGHMVHWTPSNGWLNHGFHQFQPTLFFDLAHANSYKIMAIVVLTPHRMMHFLTPESQENYSTSLHRDLNICETLAIFQKVEDKPFAIPFQTMYKEHAPQTRY